MRTRLLRTLQVLLSSNRPSEAIAKLADFGLARRLHATRQSARDKHRRM